MLAHGALKRILGAADFEVEVWAGRAAGVADAAELLALRDLVADTNGVA